jgi:hypothetical protein
MTYSIVGTDAEKNARLLVDLMNQFEAIGIGAISGFFEVSTDWCCPVCHRQKPEIARRDKNGNLLCQLVWHHDHLSHLSDRLPYYRTQLDWQDARPLDSLRGNFKRFDDVLICGDCNVAEGAAKVSAKAPSNFSFGPFEISTFIVVKDNAPHTLDRPKVAEAYKQVFPSLKIYGDVLRDLPKHEADPDSFEQIGGSACRVLSEARKKMKEKGEKP